MKELKASNTPLLGADGSSKPDIITTASGLMFSPVETIENILSDSGTPK